ncbi:hypothetical protein LX32DRAFT_137593 [Colletotrichum zoysiae]|uniref:Uncharacterized protein n=1 Tax=Colletotrichum zoysiae TaxID=1216348 RepID=A0AAD9M846_9PEZI|nr:hypothetical protein LX32DRAFT_137593 [Colletotrichum zoysiae]
MATYTEQARTLGYLGGPSTYVSCDYLMYLLSRYSFHSGPRVEATNQTRSIILYASRAPFFNPARLPRTSFQPDGCASFHSHRLCHGFLPLAWDNGRRKTPARLACYPSNPVEQKPHPQTPIPHPILPACLHTLLAMSTPARGMDAQPMWTDAPGLGRCNTSDSVGGHRHGATDADETLTYSIPGSNACALYCEHTHHGALSSLDNI